MSLSDHEKLTRTDKESAQSCSETENLFSDFLSLEFQAGDAESTKTVSQTQLRPMLLSPLSPFHR